MAQWWVLTYHLWGQGCDHQHNMKPVTLTNKVKVFVFKKRKMWGIVYGSSLYEFISHHSNKYPRKTNKGIIYPSLLSLRFQRGYGGATQCSLWCKDWEHQNKLPFLLPILLYPWRVAVHTQAESCSLVDPLCVLLICILTVCVIIPQRLLNPITVILNVICHIWDRKQGFFLFVTIKNKFPLFKPYKYRRNLSQNCNFRSPREKTSSEYDNIYI